MSAITAQSEAWEAWVADYRVKERLRKRVVYRARDMDGNWAVEAYAFDLDLFPGGWYQDEGKLKNWMTKDDIQSAERRAYERSDAAGLEASSYPDWVEHQCGGCFWHAAVGGNWGVCCNPASPLDGRMVFEHGGCKEHTYDVPARP